MITEIVPAQYFDYRLIFPTGIIVDRKLPFFARSGDILMLHKGVFRVMMADPTTVFSHAVTLYLGKES